MEHAIAIQEDFDERVVAHDVAADEVIDAFDHVLEALDEVMALAQFALPRETPRTRH